MADTIDSYNHVNFLIASGGINYADLFIELLSGSATFTAANTTKEAVDNGSSATITATIATPAVITWTAHGFSAGQAVNFVTTGALPTGLTPETTYFVIAAGLTTNTFEVSATVGGAAINTSGTQSGVHTGSAAGTFEVSGDGWPVGGPALTTVVWSQAALDSGVLNDAKLTLDNVVVNATGGPIGPASKALIYQKSNRKPLWFITFNSPQTAGSTTDFKFTWPANGIHTLTKAG